MRKIGEVVEEAREQEDVYIAAAVYLKKLIDKHHFSDGNKRTAVMVIDRFLEGNDKEFTPRKVQNTDELDETVKWQLPSMNIEETARRIKTGETPDENTD